MPPEPARETQNVPADPARLRFHWFLPTNGDGRDIVGGGHGVATGSAGTIRPASLGYLGQIARAAEQLGFEGSSRSAPACSPPPWPPRWQSRTSGTQEGACCSTW
jgi:hypothetical protein